jgi:hypothetical protein
MCNLKTCTHGVTRANAVQEAAAAGVGGEGAQLREEAGNFFAGLVNAGGSGTAYVSPPLYACVRSAARVRLASDLTGSGERLDSLPVSIQ